MPTGGWPQASTQPGQFIAQLDLARKNIAHDRALLCTRIIVPPPPVAENFNWLMHPPADIPANARLPDDTVFDRYMEIWKKKT
jgi:hypothetical protein